MDTKRNVGTEERGALANEVVFAKTILMGAAINQSLLPNNHKLIKGRLQEQVASYLTVFDFITSSKELMHLLVFICLLVKITQKSYEWILMEFSEKVEQ